MSHPYIFGATQQKGDFTTAPEISSLFGQTLAQVCHKILKEMPNAVILELGAGTGKLGVDMIKALETLKTPPAAYWILDPSPLLRERQQQSFDRGLPLWKNKIQWLDKLPEQPFCGIIIANEVLDAMPAQRFRITDTECFEEYVTYHEGRFQEEYQPSTDPYIEAIATLIREKIPAETLKERPYQSERIPELKPFFQKLFASLQKGAVLLMDYGFPRHEFYHPDRYMGTLMCHYRQQAHSDPFHYLGLQDITTHVDFTDIAEQATEAHFTLSGYTNQAAFLMNGGILELFQKIPSNTQSALQAKNAMNLLTSPSEMGELFKAMALTKNFELYPFPGFEHFDKRRTL